MKLIIIAALLAWSAAGACAQETAPYAGAHEQAIAALPASRIEALRRGEGLGYALSAELNGWPGPLHVLELAQTLRLSPDVVEDVRAIRQGMLAKAIPLGEALIAAEVSLDDLFDGDAQPSAVSAATQKAARIEAQLRAVHLNAHLKTAPLLTRHQRMLYARARGYADATHHPSHH
ncbi:MAG: hypothetical protein AAF318_04135 [Pseudomonadota bacterium]